MTPTITASVRGRLLITTKQSREFVAGADAKENEDQHDDQRRDRTSASRPRNPPRDGRVRQRHRHRPVAAEYEQNKEPRYLATVITPRLILIAIHRAVIGIEPTQVG